MSYLNRVTLLRAFTKEEPNNPFNWYALALELRDSNVEEARQYFLKLLTDFPDYLPTYYTSAHLFAELGQLDEAKQLFEKGIELANEKKEEKTLKELKSAYQNFLFEHDLDE